MSNAGSYFVRCVRRLPLPTICIGRKTRCWHLQTRENVYQVRDISSPPQNHVDSYCGAARNQSEGEIGHKYRLEDTQ